MAYAVMMEPWKRRLFLFLAFWVAVLSFFLIPRFFPTLSLFTFAPFFALLFLHTSLNSSLWIAALCGFFVDLFSTGAMGFYSANYALVALIFHRQKKNFKESPVSFCSFTFCISLLSSLLEPFLSLLFDLSIFLGGKEVFWDLFFLPLCDTLYAFLLFVVPVKSFSFLRERAKSFMIQRKI